MVRTYFLAPNFTTAPPPEGPIKLGSILRNISEFEPINQTVREIPQTLLCPVDSKHEFEIFLNQLHSADFSLRAQVLELLGLGTSASIERIKGSNKFLSCQRLDTHTFNPTDNYISKSMENSDVSSFMSSSKFRIPVYMVTGLKIARGASSKSSSSTRVAMEHDTSLAPSGSPAAVGVKAGYASSTDKGEQWNASTDFIVSFKVRKIWKARDEEVKHQAYNKKAIMQNGTSAILESTFTVQFDDDLTPEEVNEMLGQAEDGI